MPYKLVSKNPKLSTLISDEAYNLLSSTGKMSYEPVSQERMKEVVLANQKSLDLFSHAEMMEAMTWALAQQKKQIQEGFWAMGKMVTFTGNTAGNKVDQLAKVDIIEYLKQI